MGKIRKETHYIDEYNRRLWFVPLQKTDAPGFTHRVIIDYKMVDWLSTDYKPSAKTAQYFFEKHPANKEALRQTACGGASFEMTAEDKAKIESLFSWQEESAKTHWVLGEPIGR